MDEAGRKYEEIRKIAAFYTFVVEKSSLWYKIVYSKNNERIYYSYIYLLHINHAETRKNICYSANFIFPGSLFWENF